MQVTASWGGESVAVEVDAECRSVEGLKRCLQEALPEVDVEAVRLEVCGRPVDDEAVLGLVAGSVIDVSASQAALAAAALREEGCAVDFEGFCDAAKAGDLRLCKLYLEAGVVWPRRVDTPLHIAVGHNHHELCKLLLASGCDKDVQDLMSKTPLHVAIVNRNRQMIELLLESGCDLSKKDMGGKTPLYLAVCTFNAPIVKLLLESGCDAEEMDGNGYTILHLAIMKDNLQAVKVLLEFGCEKSKTANGITPLRHARNRRDTEMVKLLLESGCEE